MAQSLGLIGGSGALPVLMAREARRAGWRVVAFALVDATALTEVADRTVSCRLGEAAPILEALVAEQIRHVVFAGRVSKQELFHDLRLDESAVRLVAQSPDWTDAGLLSTVSKALAAMGIELLDQRHFLGAQLVRAGRVAGPDPDQRVKADIARGLAVARDLARCGVGQTVVIRAHSIAAVEAMEGTDATVRRGLALAGPGAVVVKAAAPAHDYRFDVPTVGGLTVALCAAGRAAAIAMEARRVLLMDEDAVAAEAARAGMSVVGVSEDSGTG